jgi:hypothetical protein
VIGSERVGESQMMGAPGRTNSEARKRGEESLWGGPTPPAAGAAREHERRREVMRDALAEVWSGAGFVDADAVLDHLHDLGAEVTFK